MWLLTQNGFFSAVEHRDDESLLMVRCRALEDARYIARKTGAKVVKSNGLADYEYRVTITKAKYAAFVVDETLSVSYSNFKDQVKKTQGSKRADVYMSVWSALCRLQPLRPYANVPLPPLPTGSKGSGPSVGSSVLWPYEGTRGGRQTQWWSDEVEGGLARLEKEAADEEAWFCSECKLAYSDCPGHERLTRGARRRANKRKAKGKHKAGAGR